ncbi:condensin-2 complex subunit D3-L-like [Tubulanus polymorphus]|uniref:condensin-2 complex subunit D3-L-like n=1 Tax=Tubulanus polymorphus TaxID=672921 RepID=UPI003DA4D28A
MDKETVSCLKQLNLNNLQEAWVDAVWKNYFTDFGALPPDFDEGSIDSLKKVVKCLKKWASLGDLISDDEPNNAAGFWPILVENNIPYKCLVAYLAYVIDKGVQRKATFCDKQRALLAARIYTCLVIVPGSGAFQIFHPMIYENTLHGLMILTQITDSDYFVGKKHRRRRSSSSSQSSSWASQQTRRRNNRKRTRTNSESSDNNEQSVEEGEDNDNELQDLSNQEKQVLRTHLTSLFKDELLLLKVFSLKSSEESLQLTLRTLVQLTRLEPKTFRSDFNWNDNDDFKQSNNITELAYTGLNLLCNPNHRDPAVTIRKLFQHLLPSLLMISSDGKLCTSAIPSPVLAIRDQTLAFITFLLDNHKASANIHTSSRALIQHLCVKVPDKIEYRTKVAQIILKLLSVLSSSAYAKLMEWFQRLSRNEKTSTRVFVIDLIGMILTQPQRQIDDSIPIEMRRFCLHTYLLKTLICRCSDISSVVRSKAISMFSNCISNVDSSIARTVQQVITPAVVARPPQTRLILTPQLNKELIPSNAGSENDPVVDMENDENRDRTNSDKTAAEQMAITGQMTQSMTVGEDGTPVVTPGTVQLVVMNNLTLEDGEGVVSMLRRRALDAKVFVRKSAVQALENIIKLCALSFNKEDLMTIHGRCLDPGLSVRKQAMQSLTEILLIYPENPDFQWAWLDGVLPLVMDRESSIVEKCLDYLQIVLLENIVAYKQSSAKMNTAAWQMTDTVATVKGTELRRYLQKAFNLMAKKSMFRRGLMKSLITHIDTANNNAAWMLLSELAPAISQTNVDTDPIIDYWNNIANNLSDNDFPTLNRVLLVLGSMAKHVSAQTCQNLIDNLQHNLSQFDSPPELISTMVSTLSKLYNAKYGDVSKAREEIGKWCSDLLKVSDGYLSGVILAENPADAALNEDLIIKHLFTVGELCQLCPTSTPRRIAMLVISLVAAPCIEECSSNSQPAESSEHQQQQQSLSQQTLAVPSNQDVLSQKSSQGFSQGYTQVLSQFSGSKMSTTIRAHAFVTLGKLCLQNESLAKKSIAAMARELETCQDIPIRNNIVIILCDFCVRYTTLTDRYISNIASCVKDPSPLIRKQTLTLLTHLLQEDYLKWKSLLFFRFISTVVDDHSEIEKFAKFCLVDLLLPRNPNMFFQHFIECIFHFNSYEDHMSYNKFPQIDRDKELFSLKGPENSKKRHAIYRFLLENLQDHHRFQLTAKITSEILGGVVDEIIPFDDKSLPLLQDSLSILCCKEIKLSTLRHKTGDDLEEQQELAEAVVATAKKNIITQVVKKNVIENIVPIAIALKHMCEKQRSPLLKDLMNFLQELMKDYKNEVKDILSADKQLAEEIEYDLQRFEQDRLNAQRKAEEAAKTADARTNSPVTDQVARNSLAIQPPILNLLNAANSRRRSSVSAAELITSAKKAVEEAKRLTEIRNSPTAAAAPMNHGAMNERSPLVNNANPGTTNDRSPLVNNDNPGMTTAINEPSSEPLSPALQTLTVPPVNNVLRAISTPHRSIDNITFYQGDIGVSPIPTTTRKPKGKRSVIASKRRNLRSDNTAIDTTEPDILFTMPTENLFRKPDAPPPRIDIVPPSDAEKSESAETSAHTSLKPRPRRKLRSSFRK